MGLTTWKNSPKGKVLKSDVTVAKNYLNHEEVSKLNRLVGMFIDFAELRALNRQVMTMKDWLRQVKRFLDFNEQQVLTHAGKISHEMAVAKAHEEFEKYRVTSNMCRTSMRRLRDTSKEENNREPTRQCQQSTAKNAKNTKSSRISCLCALCVPCG